jgi:CheY-like chemotaxis protein/HPt (histidine-containing phosphotransfer) domain-containing protein
MVAERMRQLRVAYLDNMRGQAAAVETALAQCREGALTAEARAQLKIVAHKLAGTGATYGFALLSRVARRLDDRMIEAPDAAPHDLEGLARPLLVACREALAEAEPAPPADMRAQALAPPAATRSPGFGKRNVSAASPPQMASPPSAPDGKRRPLILVADDDMAIQDLFASLFADEARLVFAANSDEALHVMRRTPPDLVLLDDIMPGGVTGLTFLENLKGMRDLQHIPVVMITASDGEAHIERGMAAGAVGYITKPFDAAVAAKWIRNLFPAL